MYKIIVENRLVVNYYEDLIHAIDPNGLCNKDNFNELTMALGLVDIPSTVQLEKGNPLGLCLSLCLSLGGFSGADETF